MRRATAQAHPNLALVKYWGKRDELLILPYTDSVSVVLDGCMTTTTVEVDASFSDDEIYLRKGNEGMYQRMRDSEDISRMLFVLDFLRARVGCRYRARVLSYNNFPTAAGLASSASGSAAFVTAAAAAFGYACEKSVLSLLARQVSGSGCRSIEGGFSAWVKGDRMDGLDSYARQLYDETYWPELRVMSIIVENGEKQVSSREGMRRTIETSPHFEDWVRSVPSHVQRIHEGLQSKNIGLVGMVAEESARMMHALAATASPPVVYWSEGTKKILRAVERWRMDGLQVYYSVDAGPQVKVIYVEKEHDALERLVQTLVAREQIIFNKVGCGARLVDEYLSLDLL